MERTSRPNSQSAYSSDRRVYLRVQEVLPLGNPGTYVVDTVFPLDL